MASTAKEPENIKERLKASYDAIAPTYNAWTTEHSPKRLEYLEQVITLLNESENPSDTADSSSSRRLHILELGCGCGRPVTERLLQAFPAVHVTANDLSSTQIQIAKAALGERGEKAVSSSDKAGNDVEWIQGDMMELAFGDGQLDAVAAFFSIIHLPLGEQTALMGRVSRWLQPGGFFVANFGDKAHAGVVMEHWLGDKGWMFWSGHGVEGTRAMVRDAGLDIVVDRIEKDDVDADFHWVIAKCRADS